MKTQARNTKRYVDHVGNIMSAKEIVPLQFHDPSSDAVNDRIAEKQLNLSLKDFNTLACKEGFFVRM